MPSLILKTTATLQGMGWANNRLLGRTHSPRTGETLNEKWSIHQNTQVTPGSQMFIQYYCIGNGALIAEPNPSDNSVNFTDSAHKPINGSLYNHIPFAARHIDEDFSPAERAKYGMRRPFVKDGEVYMLYMLRAFGVVNSENTYNEITVDDGKITNRQVYTPTVANLNPTKPNYSLSEAIESKSDFYEVVNPLDISFTENDAQELHNALSLIYEDPTNKGVVSEMGLVAGYKNTVPLLDGNNNPTAGNYDECLRAVITDIMNLEATNLVSSNEGINLTINIGSSVPKIGIGE